MGILLRIGILFAAAVSGLASSTLAQQAEQIESMKLLAPGVGWVQERGNLLWTTNGGRQWKDVTPRLNAGQSVDSVFFLGTARGWALLIGDDGSSDGPRFDLASTSDAGASWSIVPLTFPPNRGVGPFAGGAHIDFVDSLHGWINIPIVSSAAFRLAALLETSDGGKTWEWAPGGSGTEGRIFFLNRNDGWVAGGPGDQHLYETHDGARSWHELSLQAPPGVSDEIYPTYEQPPVFEDNKRGFLPVTFSGREGTQSQLLLFATDNGGKTWVLDRALPLSSQISVGQWLPSTVTDSELITLFPVDDQKQRITRISPGDKISSMDVSFPGSSAIERISFAGTNVGWVAADDKLWLTSDGGASWSDVSPKLPAPIFR